MSVSEGRLCSAGQSGFQQGGCLSCLRSATAPTPARVAQGLLGTGTFGAERVGQEGHGLDLLVETLPRHRVVAPVVRGADREDVAAALCLLEPLRGDASQED